MKGAYFIENWAGVLRAAKENGLMPTFLTAQRKIPMVATKDIGRVAAESLVNPAKGRRVIELAGPEEYSPEDIARVLGALLGHGVRVEQAPLTAVAPTVKSFGFSEDVARLFEEMHAGINSGHIAFEKKGTEFRRGTVSPAEVFKGLLKQSLQGASS